jgi:hypothetical protein
VILGTTDIITPSSFVRALSRTRESRQSLNLSMDKMRTMPRRTDQPPLSPPPTSGLPSRPGQGRTGPPPNVPSAMVPGSSRRNGAVGGARPIQGPRSPTTQAAYTRGYERAPGSSHGSQHTHSSSRDSKDGDKKEKEKKKKKFGMF